MADFGAMRCVCRIASSGLSRIHGMQGVQHATKLGTAFFQTFSASPRPESLFPFELLEVWSPAVRKLRLKLQDLPKKGLDIRRKRMKPMHDHVG